MKNLTLIICILLTACSRSNFCNIVESKRITSPDGLVDAVLTQSGCDATSGDAYRVSLVLHGKPVIDDEYIYLADKITDLNIEWEANKILQIHYRKARIFEFSNFWQTKALDNYSYVVNVELVNLENKKNR